MYNGLIECLNQITSSLDAQSYSEALEDEPQIHFAGLFSSLGVIVENLEKARGDESLFGNYDQILSIIDEFESEFSDFALSLIKEIKIIVEISKSVSNQIVDLTSTVEIPAEQFELLEISELNDISIECYCFKHNNLMDSMFVLNPSNIPNLAEFLNDNPNIDLELLFVLLSKFHETSSLSLNKYILLERGKGAFRKRITNSLYLHYVSDGKSYHRVTTRLSLPINNWRQGIRVDNKYQQFETEIYILSEYNRSSDILAKFLKLYQVIENFVYKSVLVKLEAQRNGQMFSLRDFKVLNENIAKGEKEALEKFFDTLLSLEGTPGTSFKTSLHSQWIGLLPQFGGVAARIEAVLALFAIRDSYASIVEGNFNKILSRVIYSLRNSIVHNKATEYHLTYSSITPDTALLIRDYLLPVMEQLCFYLISVHTNSLVWFSNENLSLWEDN